MTGMKRRRVIILAGAVVVLGVCLAKVWPRDDGPEYNGRKLSEWMNVVANHPYEEYEEAVESVRAIGGKGTAYFLKWLQYEPPKWRGILQDLVNRLPSRPLRTVLPAVNRRENLANTATWALIEIEPEDSKSVVAELERLSRDLKRPVTAHRAKLILAYKEWGR